ncbi:uncharacterized protein LOC109602530 isoform X4 [Aethina tumida]|uniref:uncharacterized protein LOC109602530 isoform X4 n=1 Tax=Aethina tumida TaxID=116153 RepID=UPI002148225B|nr:uncharacterized protein LOC109602530 isoform X4 [Aethina tumida]
MNKDLSDHIKILMYLSIYSTNATAITTFSIKAEKPHSGKDDYEIYFYIHSGNIKEYFIWTYSQTTSTHLAFNNIGTKIMITSPPCYQKNLNPNNTSEPKFITNFNKFNKNKMQINNVIINDEIIYYLTKTVMSEDIKELFPVDVPDESIENVLSYLLKHGQNGIIFTKKEIECVFQHFGVKIGIKANKGPVRGFQYEEKIFTLVALRCCFDTDIKYFEIMSNAPAFGALDDMVLKIIFPNGEKHLVLGQMKHSIVGEIKISDQFNVKEVLETSQLHRSLI